MLKTFYLKYILKYPIQVIFLVLLSFVFFGINTTKLQIDASSETLLLEDDKDLKFSQEVAKRYSTSDFLVLTYSPQSKLLSKESLSTIDLITQDLKKLKLTASITSILNVPLLQSPIIEIKDLIDGVKTLRSKNVDKKLVKKEFISSPLYKNSLVSPDFKTTAIVINLKKDYFYENFLETKEEFRVKGKEGKLTKNELLEFNQLKSEFSIYQNTLREKEHQNILQIRKIITKYNKDDKLFLGGVSMIADDIITFIKDDLLIYGSALLLILTLVLWFIFRQIRWVILPLAISFLSVIATSGILGYFGWKVTVISSNFISLQLIITLSIVLHLIVRYRELSLKYTRSSQKKLVLNTVLSKANPSLFAIITTIAGFSSLIFSNIQPIINLGYMMSFGIAVSLVISFIIFPAVLIKLPVIKPYTKFEENIHFTNYCAKLVLTYKNYIFLVTFIVLLLSIYGSSKLLVENSFINYFKKDTHIYQGMEVIDKQLGGTTPLDIILTFKESSKIETTEEVEDEYDSFDEEFEEDEANNKEQYWFTPDKMNKIIAVHDYLESLSDIGKVSSFATLLKVGKTLNEGKDLDSFMLALLYNKIPAQYKETIFTPYLNIEKNQVRFSTRIIDSNEELRRDVLLKKIKKDLKPIVGNDSYELSNLMVLYNNMLQSLFKSQVSTLGFVLLILFIMFLFLFKSTKIALIAIITNLIPIGLIFAIMGFAGIPLDIMTITIAAISIGIGVDDTIHYIHRFKEEFKKDHNYNNAMIRSHNSIGYAMTYTSFAIILGFSILIFSNLIPTIYFGLLTVVVMISILASALLLLPQLIIVLKPFSKK